MDEMTLLRQIHDEVSPPGPDVVAQARTRLLAEALTPQTGVSVRQRAPRRRRHTVGLRLAAAAAAAAALFATDVVIAGQPWHASAEASTTVRRGIGAATRDADPVLRSGQFLYRRMVTTFPQIPKARLVHEVWIPADVTDRWIKRTSFTNGDGVTGQPEAAAARNGRFFVPEQPDWHDPDTAFLQALPTDPPAVLARLRQDGITEADEQWRVLAGALTGPYVKPDADMRAALLGALTRIPGAKSSGDTVGIGERKGTAIWRTDWDLFRSKSEIIVDPDTGEVLGSRHTYGTLLGKAIGDHGNENVKTLHQQVVDSAPTPR